MNTMFQEISDVMADERFLSWYFQEDNDQARAWTTLIASDTRLTNLTDDAAVFLRSLQASEVPVTRNQVEESLDKLRARRDSLVSAGENPVRRMTSRRGWWAAAAAVLVIVIGSIFFFRHNEERAAIASNYGQLRNNQLPDGSTVLLNANSKVSLSSDWGGNNDREVWLEGEAFFKITKTAQKKRFIVHTGKLDVIVTGTQFNVSNRDGRTTVLLTEGSVTLLMNDGKEIKMKPGDYWELKDEAIAKKEVNEGSVLAWKDNGMGFDNTPWEEVAHIISNHYGVNVVLGDDSIRFQPGLSGIMKNNNLDELLKAIDMTNQAKIQRNKDEIIISSNTQ